MSGSDSDDTDGTAPEPRVKDLLAAKEVQQLMDWFHLPPPPPDAPPPQDDEWEQRQRKVEALILPSMYDLGFRMQDRADALRARTRPLELTEWGQGMIRPHLEVRLAGEPVDREIPYEINEALDINTPQAMLRDLYRTEDEYYIQYAPPWEGEMEPFVDANALAREAMRGTYLVWPLYTPAMHALDATRDDVRSRLALNWAELGSRKDDWTPPVRRTRGPSR
jgi:hypothetical protein